MVEGESSGALGGYSCNIRIQYFSSRPHSLVDAHDPRHKGHRAKNSSHVVIWTTLDSEWE